MTWSAGIRRFHRCTAILFTLTVIANFVAMTMGKPPPWIVYSPLPFLFLLLPSGLYMFFLPYVTKRPEEGAVSVGGDPLPEPR